MHPGLLAIGSNHVASSLLRLILEGASIGPKMGERAEVASAMGG